MEAPLSGSWNKAQHLLGFTIDTLFLRIPISHVLFVTLTFPKPIKSVRQAQKHLNSFLNKVRPRHRNYLWVLEPHSSGRIHFHLLIPVSFDTHAGTDLNAWRDRDLHDDNLNVLHHSMNPLLQAEDNWWTTTTRRYGFGLVEVAPIHSTAKAIRLYLAKQDWRSWSWPFVEKTSFRFWGCSTGMRAGTQDFVWNSPGAQAYRHRLRDWAHQMGCQSLDDLRSFLGKKWSYQFRLYLEDIWTRESRHLPEGSGRGSKELMTQGRASGRVGISKESETPAESGLRKRPGTGREAESGRAASRIAPAPAPTRRTPLSSLRTLPAITGSSKLLGSDSFLGPKPSPSTAQAGSSGTPPESSRHGQLGAAAVGSTGRHAHCAKGNPPDLHRDEGLPDARHVAPAQRPSWRGIAFQRTP